MNLKNARFMNPKNGNLIMTKFTRKDRKRICLTIKTLFNNAENDPVYAKRLVEANEGMMVISRKRRYEPQYVYWVKRLRHEYINRFVK